MNIPKALLLTASHSVVAVAGFAAGIYVLPIWIAPDAPSEAQIEAATAQALFTGKFRRDLKGSDALHWGEGTVTISPTAITLVGQLAPGPD